MVEQFLQFTTSYEEIESVLPFFHKLNNLNEKTVSDIFPGESNGFMIHKFKKSKNSYLIGCTDYGNHGLAFFHTLDPGNQGTVCQYFGYIKSYFKIYRADNFLKTIRNEYSEIVSQTIFGTNKKIDLMDIIMSYSKLSNEDKNKLIKFSNERNDKYNVLM